MSKYIKGDKVVMEITDKFKNSYGHEYYSILDSVYSTEFIDEKSEPLRDYTEPMKAKIRRQAAEITRLLAENKRLKAENGNSLWNIEQARAYGAETAWELAKKCMLMTDRERETIFGSGHNALYGVLTYFDYKHAAAKVAEREKAKEEIKVGDVYKSLSGNFVVCGIDREKDMVKALWDDLSVGKIYLYEIKEQYTKTGRHIDIDNFLKQIGGEQK